MTTHMDDKGIRYGVIAMNRKLDPDLEQELWYGSGAVDLSYQQAYEEARKQAARDYDAHLENAHIAAAEVDPNMGEADHERFVEKWFADHDIEFDEEQFIEDELERFSDMYMCDEPDINGEYEGVKYEISWLGGAPLLTIIEGPIGYARQLCSICVPNAADLDNGFIPGGCPEADRQMIMEQGYMSYVVPADWLRKDLDEEGWW